MGGGLCGLHTAHELSKRNIDFILVEARNRFGGRILSKNVGSTDYRPDLTAVDFGPSWFWPGQPLIQGLIAELGLSTQVFAQHETGDALFEDEQTVRRGMPGISMAGAYRLKGGMRQLVAALEEKLDGKPLLSDSVLHKLVYAGDTVRADVIRHGEPCEILSDIVVFSMPPRLLARSIAFDPMLEKSRQAALTAIPTWMAGHAKLVAAYDEPFWRREGLSGDAISYRGPLGEIHDASGDGKGPFALFGFFNVPPAHRAGRDEELKAAAIGQLSRLFGQAAASPLEVTIKDWASEPYTATELDQQALNQHTFNSLQELTEPGWDGRLVWSGSEMAPGPIGGYLEGAVHSGTRAVDIVETRLGSDNQSTT